MKMQRTLSFVGVLAIALTAKVQAFPTNTRENCNACHDASAAGRMQVTGQDSITNIGVRLDGVNRGSQKMFDVTPGGTVTLSSQVLDGSGTYALELKGLWSARGLKNSQTDALTWSAPNATAQGWTRWGAANFYYATTAPYLNNTTPTVNFDLAIGAATPVDVYELTFAVATSPNDSNNGYMQETFYLNVLNPVPEPATYALLGLGSLAFVAYRRRSRKA